MYERKYDNKFIIFPRNSFSISFSAFSKHIHPTTEQNLQEIEADDLLLKRQNFEKMIVFSYSIDFVELKCELEQRFTALEELNKSGSKYNPEEVQKEIDALEKLQYKYNKIEAKRKKLAKQNYEQVEGSHLMILLDEVCLGF